MDAYIARLVGFAMLLDQEIEVVRRIGVLGVKAPGFVPAKISTQMQALRALPPEESPLLMSAPSNCPELGDCVSQTPAVAAPTHKHAHATNRLPRAMSGLGGDPPVPARGLGSVITANQSLFAVPNDIGPKRIAEFRLNEPMTTILSEYDVSVALVVLGIAAYLMLGRLFPKIRRCAGLAP